MNYQFEQGKLVKVNSIRVEYLSGYQMIATIKELGEEVAKLQHSVTELTGVIDEYLDMPCDSLLSRMKVASRRHAIPFVGVLK